MRPAVTRRDVLGFRFRAQQLDRTVGSLDDTAVLDFGVQDTGPDGAPWALAVRGVDASALHSEDLVMVWTIRGAPHVYRRSDLPLVAAAVQPFSDADAGKRIYNAAKPLQAAGIGNLEALDAVAAAMREVVTSPMVKGEVSTRLSAIMDEPYLHFCRPCNATHLYEMPFRLAAFRAGLELQPGTSPPVLHPIEGFQPSDLPSGPELPERLDPIRCYLRLLGPASPKHVAAYLDAPLEDVKERWPQDTVEVSVDEETRWVLAEDAEGLRGGANGTRLLGPFDLFLQARDRGLLVSDPAHAKALWPALGRPGAVVVGGEIAGMWRPRKSGRRLALQVQLWQEAAQDAVDEQAERLATHRGLRLSAVDLS